MRYWKAGYWADGYWVQDYWVEPESGVQPVQPLPQRPAPPIGNLIHALPIAPVIPERIGTIIESLPAAPVMPAHREPVHAMPPAPVQPTGTDPVIAGGAYKIKSAKPATITIQGYSPITAEKEEDIT